MAVICYASTGSNTSPYDDWSKAATLLATALAAATSGDTVQLDMVNIASGDAELSGTTTWTVPAGVTLHVGTQNGASGITTGDMATTYWLGNSTTGRQITFAFGLGCRVIGGLTLRQHSNSALLFGGGAANTSLEVEKVTFWHSATSTSGATRFGNGVGNSSVRVGTLVMEYAQTSGTLAVPQISGSFDIDKLTVNSGGATVTTGFFDDTPTAGNLSVLRVNGGNISAIGSGAILVANAALQGLIVYLNNVILPASFGMVAAQTDLRAGAELFIRDCSSSGSAVPFAYANAIGEIRLDTGIYLTAGLAAAAWKITTTADASSVTPFRSPWIDEYKAAASVIPQFEILRDGSTTAYTDAQVWMETLAKVTASSVVTTLFSTLGTGTNIPAGAGLGSWTGESGTAWSGKLSQGSKTLTGDGFVMSQICVGVASATVYVDPGQVG